RRRWECSRGWRGSCRDVAARLGVATPGVPRTVEGATMPERPEDGRRAAQDGVDELARMGIDPRALGLVPPEPPPATRPRSTSGAISPAPSPPPVHSDPAGVPAAPRWMGAKATGPTTSPAAPAGWPAEPAAAAW